MSIVSDSLNILDSARALLSDVGLRPYRVYVQTKTFSRTMGIAADATTVVTELTVADGKPPKVRQLSAKEVVSSGGTLGDAIYEVGPLTPPYSGGGVETSAITPDTGAKSQVLYILKGPGLATNGVYCDKVSDKFDSPFRYMFTIKRTGADVP